MSVPQGWGIAPEARLLSEELRSLIHAAIDSRPPSQLEVVCVRDSQAWTADEVCDILQISETNQRVLLHRGRSRVRRALERCLLLMVQTGRSCADRTPGTGHKAAWISSTRKPGGAGSRM